MKFNLPSIPSIAAERHDELPFWSAPFGISLLERIDYKPDIWVLDLGCGSGFPLLELAMRLGPNAKLYGLDPWKEGLDIIRKKVSHYGLTQVELIQGEAESIPLDEQVIDLIVSNNGLNNVKDIDLAFTECARVLKRGGQIIQTLNLPGSMKEFYEMLGGVFKELHLHTAYECMIQHIYQKRRPVEVLKALMEAKGFIVLEVITDQFNYHFSNGTAMFGHHFIRTWFLEAWMGLMPQDQTGRIFRILEERMNAIALEKGQWTLSIPFALIQAEKA